MRYHVPRSLACLLALCAVFACTDHDASLAPVPRRTADIEIELSRADALAGDTVIVALRTRQQADLAALQADITFDPAKIKYVGQDANAPALVVVNAEEERTGALTVATLSVKGLPERSVVLAFEVITAGYDGSLGIRSATAFDSRLQEVAIKPALDPDRIAANLQLAGRPEMLTGAEWVDHHYPQLLLREQMQPAREPGEYRLNLRYGDVTLNGSIDVADVLFLARVAAGLSGLIAGSNSPDIDAVVAGNVTPPNLPGLGEPGDDVPPGIDADGGRTVNVGDALAIAREASGMETAITGELIPGRGPIQSFDATLGGDLTADRTLSKDTTYRVQGTLRITNGATLTIEAGTRIEGTSLSSQIVVMRDSRIDARGTLLEPILFACSGTSPECWSGIVLLGHAPINVGAATSPPARGNGQAGCLELTIPAGSYGGCDPADNSGTLRFVRIQNARGGLTLAGVGSGTMLDFIQVDQGETGVAVLGGTAEIKHLVTTGQTLLGMTWSAGWTGKGQYVILTNGMRGDNGGSALPASSPTLYNISTFFNTSNGIIFAGGTGGSINNALLYGGTVALEIADSPTCTQIGTSGLTFRNSMWAGFTIGGNPDADPAPCSGFSSPGAEQEWFTDAANNNQIESSISGLLTSDNTNLPDWRPVPGTSLATMSAATPPSDGFFDPAATFVGAVPPASATLVSIPWYSGWTLPPSSRPVPTLPSLSWSQSTAIVSAAQSVDRTFIIPAPSPVPIAISVMHAEAGISLSLGTYTFPAGATGPIGIPAYVIAGLGVGTDTLTASAPGYLPSKLVVTVEALGVLLPWAWPSTVQVGDSVLVELRTAGPDGVCCLNVARPSGGPEVLQLAGPHNVAFGNGTSGITSIDVPSGQSTTGSFYMKGITAGEIEIQVTSANYQTLMIPVTVTAAPEGIVRGQVVSPTRGSLEGVTVTVQPAALADVTDGDGNFELQGVPAGAATIQLSGLPAGCSNPGTRSITVPAGGSVVEDFSVACVPPQIIAGGLHTCALVDGGSVYCWGENFTGALGDNSTIDRRVPTEVSGLVSFSMVSTGGLHTCALSEGNAAYCWGNNSSGALGDNSTINRLVPTPVSGGLEFTQIVAGGAHTCALDAAGAAYCWGENGNGQLGNNSTTDKLVPHAVSGGKVFTSLTAGGLHTCGLTSSGAAYCWGWNEEGQLGDNTTSDRQVPTLVSGGHAFVQIQAGGAHTCGRKSTGIVYCWGENGEGQLGDNTTNDRKVPTTVAGGLSFAQIAVGGIHTCARTAASVAYCWGRNSEGEVGDNTLTDRKSPTLVSGGLSFAQVVAGGAHSCGVTTSGAAYCWGKNISGQIGDNTLVNRKVPTLVSGGLIF